MIEYTALFWMVLIISNVFIATMAIVFRHMHLKVQDVPRPIMFTMDAYVSMMVSINWYVLLTKIF